MLMLATGGEIMQRRLIQTRVTPGRPQTTDTRQSDTQIAKTHTYLINHPDITCHLTQQPAASRHSPHFTSAKQDTHQLPSTSLGWVLHRS
jgi:hypothetical protein